MLQLKQREQAHIGVFPCQFRYLLQTHHLHYPLRELGQQKEKSSQLLLMVSILNFGEWLMPLLQDCSTLEVVVFFLFQTFLWFYSIKLDF